MEKKQIYAFSFQFYMVYYIQIKPRALRTKFTSPHTQLYKKPVRMFAQERGIAYLLFVFQQVDLCMRSSPNYQLGECLPNHQNPRLHSKRTI